MNPELAYECAECANVFEDFEEAANCCGKGYYDAFFCGGAAKSISLSTRQSSAAGRKKMIRFEYECAGEGCGFASDDMQEALDHCDAGADTLYICANCGKRHGWEINAQACCQEEGNEQ
jgi:DNA-directed RNA polymerase subunit RPC12/RpoP